jgi:methylmalonyl-CoA/ethylmalonyl-CoA epimerase
MARVLRIDHIAVAVRDLHQALARYQALFGAELVSLTDLHMNNTRLQAAYLKIGDGLIVLDGAAQPDGFLARFIEKRGEGLHHIAIVVDDLDGYVRDLEAKGVRIPHREQLGPLRREILLSPKDTHGVVVQVIEWSEGDLPTMEERLARLHRFLRTQGDHAAPAAKVGELLLEVGEARRRVTQAATGLSARQGVWKPAPEEWSVAECLEHLVLAEQAGVAGLWKAIDGIRQGQPVWSGDHVNRGVPVEELVSRSLPANPQAPPIATPRLGGPVRYWIETFEASQTALESLARELGGLDPGEVIWPHPAAGPLDTYQRLGFLSLHMELHRAQIEAVKAAPGFPRN